MICSMACQKQSDSAVGLVQGRLAPLVGNDRRKMELLNGLLFSLPGTPVSIADLLYRPEHSLIDQSLHSKLGAETTNGDGFGVGWHTPAGPVLVPAVEADDLLELGADPKRRGWKWPSFRRATRSTS